MKQSHIVPPDFQQQEKQQKPISEQQTKEQQINMKTEKMEQTSQKITLKPKIKESIKIDSQTKELENNDFDSLFDSRNFSGNENKVPESQIARAYQFGMLGFGIAGGAISHYFKSKLSPGKQQGSYMKNQLFEILDKKTFHILNESNAERITKSLCKMRGAPLKLAQALSIQDDNLIPKSVRMAFEKAREQADIMPKSQLYMMLEQQLGSDWKNKFKAFNETPFAAASIGQVHQALDHNNKLLAVKIQYPGVKESIQNDLKNLTRLMNLTGAFPKSMFLDRLIHNTELELMQECDYNKQRIIKILKMYI